MNRTGKINLKKIIDLKKRKYLATGSALLGFILILMIEGCKPPSGDQPTDPATSAAQPEDSVVIPADTTHPIYAGLYEPATVKAFYRWNRHLPAWINKRKLSTKGNSMVSFIRSIRNYGLLPQDYHLQEIEELLNAPPSFDERIHLGRADILLTDAFMSIARHLKHGRVDRTLHRIPGENKADTTQLLLLKKVLAGNGVQSTLESQQPATPSYLKLRAALEETLQSADSGEQSLLRSGHTPDSLDIARKVAAIEINMERWRWESGFPARYIMINIPSYRLTVTDSSGIALESKVIVGLPDKRTPILNSVIECFIIYPYWNVPRSIATNEILPHIKKDTAYLSRHNYDVLSANRKVLNPATIEWEKYDENNFPFFLRQREGNENTLGVIKFYFENPYGVYLHDTNAKYLFNRKMRALSHGCIRMEKASELAFYLVHDDNTYCSPDDLEQYFHLQQRLEITLLHPIPIYTRYFTCDFEGNILRFYEDIYRRDKALSDAIYGNKLAPAL